MSRLTRRRQVRGLSDPVKGGAVLALVAVGGLAAYFFARSKKDAAVKAAELEKESKTLALEAAQRQADADRAAGLEKIRLQAEADRAKAEAAAKAAEAEAEKEAARLKAEADLAVRLEQQRLADQRQREQDTINEKKKQDELKRRQEEESRRLAEQQARQMRLLKYSVTPPKGYTTNRTLAEIAREQYGDWRYWSLIAEGNAPRLKELGFDTKFRDRGPLEVVWAASLPKGLVLDLPPNGADMQAAIAAYGGKDAIFTKSARYSWMVFPGLGEKARYTHLFGEDKTVP